jgi:AraC family transcriptional regulator
MLGVMYSRPEAERSHPHEAQYIAAVPVSSTAEIPEGMVARAVPEATFAVFTHRGPITNIGQTVAEIYRDWLPQSAYRHAGIADIELYDHRFNCENDQSEMEYWISITPKQGTS